MTELQTEIVKMLKDVVQFAFHGAGLKLRNYQVDAARAIIDSIQHKRGHSIVIMFPRQSGKNELQAQVETYLLILMSQMDTEIVKVSPTWKPQSLNAMRRLERVLTRNIITQDRWEKESGYIYRFGKARIFFMSGGLQASVVGATANVLLECDEAQDITTGKWDKDFAPMAASTNATKVFFGTTWTSRTLLARELRAAQAAEDADGCKRVFRIDADDVKAEVPAYGKHVAEQEAKLGRDHPFVKTQYYSEEIDAEGGMFNAQRLAMMQGDHAPAEKPDPDKLYAAMIDVAGEEEDKDGQLVENVKPRKLGTSSKRDSTALTIVEVDLTSLGDELINAPIYRTVKRYLWTGDKHVDLYAKIKAICDHWQVRQMVIDATGVGAGLSSFFEHAYPGKVTKYQFTAKSKSMLGWGFLAVIETGRYKEYKAKNEVLQRVFFRQAEHCQMEVIDGPNKEMRWGVPDGTRDTATGEIVHDDLLISAAMCMVLDKMEWGVAVSEVAEHEGIFSAMAEAF
jgi:hypothetical protein